MFCFRFFLKAGKTNSVCEGQTIRTVGWRYFLNAASDGPFGPSNSILVVFIKRFNIQFRKRKSLLTERP